MSDPVAGSAAQIAALLGRIIHSRSLLTLRIGSSPQAYTSLLLGVDLRSGWLFLDAPHPEVPGALLYAGAPLRVSGRLDGGHFEFRCKLDASVSRDGAPALRADLPAEILYDERRANFRLPIPAAFATDPVVLSGPGSTLRARLVDLSDSGVGALVAEIDGANVGDVLLCQLRLPQLQLLTDAEVRSLVGAARGHRVGLLFCALSPDQRQRIAGALSLMQRRMIRGSTARA